MVAFNESENTITRESVCDALQQLSADLRAAGEVLQDKYGDAALRTLTDAMAGVTEAVREFVDTWPGPEDNEPTDT